MGVYAKDHAIDAIAVEGPHMATGAASEILIWSKHERGKLFLRYPGT